MRGGDAVEASTGTSAGGLGATDGNAGEAAGSEADPSRASRPQDVLWATRPRLSRLSDVPLTPPGTVDTLVARPCDRLSPRDPSLAVFSRFRSICSCSCPRSRSCFSSTFCSPARPAAGPERIEVGLAPIRARPLTPGMCASGELSEDGGCGAASGGVTGAPCRRGEGAGASATGRGATPATGPSTASPSPSPPRPIAWRWSIACRAALGARPPLPSSTVAHADTASPRALSRCSERADSSQMACLSAPRDAARLEGRAARARGATLRVAARALCGRADRDRPAAGGGRPKSGGTGGRPWSGRSASSPSSAEGSSTMEPGSSRHQSTRRGRLGGCSLRARRNGSGTEGGERERPRNGGSGRPGSGEGGRDASSHAARVRDAETEGGGSSLAVGEGGAERTGEHADDGRRGACERAPAWRDEGPAEGGSVAEREKALEGLGSGVEAREPDGADAGDEERETARPPGNGREGAVEARTPDIARSSCSRCPPPLPPASSSSSISPCAGFPVRPPLRAVPRDDCTSVALADATAPRPPTLASRSEQLGRPTLPSRSALRALPRPRPRSPASSCGPTQSTVRSEHSAQWRLAARANTTRRHRAQRVRAYGGGQRASAGVASSGRPRATKGRSTAGRRAGAGEAGHEADGGGRPRGGGESASGGTASTAGRQTELHALGVRRRGGRNGRKSNRTNRAAGVKTPRRSEYTNERIFRRTDDKMRRPPRACFRSGACRPEGRPGLRERGGGRARGGALAIHDVC